MLAVRGRVVPPGPDPGRRLAALGGGSAARGCCSAPRASSPPARARTPWRRWRRPGPHSPALDRREIAARIPFVAAPWKARVPDPLGGRLRIRRALAALARRVDVHRAEVASVAGDGSVTLPDGTLVRGDRVLICAGMKTPALFGPLGVEFAPHTRVTYQGADATRAACLSAPEGYALPLGSTGRWALRWAEGARPRGRARTLPVALAGGPGGRASRSARRGWTPAATIGRSHAAAVSPRSSAATSCSSRRCSATGSRRPRSATSCPSDLTLGAQRESRLPRWRRCGPRAFRWWTRRRARGSRGATIAVVHTTAYWSAGPGGRLRYGSSR